MKHLNFLILLAALICVASCKKDPVLVSSVTVSPASAQVTEGESVTLKATVSPSDAEYSGITWSSSNSSVAMVGSDGTVMGVSPGTATVTASAGGVKGSSSITVVAKTIAVTGVNLNKEELYLVEGDDAQLTATVAPDNATDKNVSWSSSDEKVATVSSDGKVTAVKAGTATITVTTGDGGKTAICKVTVLTNIGGALSGVFSVSDTKKVRFSKGNLVATIDASGVPTAWKFDANQYDYLGKGGANQTIGTAAGDVDLFGWSTESTYYGISTSTSSSDYSGDFVDWGKKIGDGSTWRTLSKDEWVYLFKTRSNASSLYKYGVTVCGKTNCVVIAPDGYTGTIAASYDASTWPVAEAAGLVCLPAAGSRSGSSVSYDGGNGYYWSSSANGSSFAYIVLFNSSSVTPGNYDARDYGSSVRLITDVK